MLEICSILQKRSPQNEKIYMQNKPFFRSFLSKVFLSRHISMAVKKIYLLEWLEIRSKKVYVDPFEYLRKVLVDEKRRISVEIEVHDASIWNIDVYAKEGKRNDLIDDGYWIL